MGCNISSPASKDAAAVKATKPAIGQDVGQAPVVQPNTAAASGSSVEKRQGTLNLGEALPNFEVDTTEGKFKLHDYFGNGWGVLFSHPADFTPVCTTELNLVLQFLPEFAKRNAKVIALSCDPVDSHVAWSKDVLAYDDKTKQSTFSYPIIADPNREIAVKLGMLDAVSKDAAGLPLTARAVFIFGPDKTLKLSILYPATTGRNFNEIIRVLDSLQLTSQRRLATPADWDHGQDCVVASSVTTEDARKLFPKGVRIVDLPSKKPYLRFTPDPSGDEAPTLPPLAAVTPSAPKQSGLNLGDVLPNFEADTTQGKIKFHDFLGSSWGVLFSHPADFTPVCTTELSSVAKLDQEFRSRDVKVACISCDPVDSHRAWSDDIVAYCGTDIKELPFPIIADEKREIATQLGMLDAVSKDAAGLPNTCRAVFIIGPDKKLKLSLLYPATTGRNFREVLRAIDSLQLTATRRLATPGNWILGQDCVVASSVSTEEAIKLFPKGVRIVDLPSKKPYLRFTPFPDPEPQTAAPATPFAAVSGASVEKKQGTLNLGEALPNFEVDTTEGKFKLHDYFGNGWGILFSHPADFTPVCTTELNLVLQFLPEFAKRNAKVIALSCDPVDSHVAWSKDVLAYDDKTKQSTFSYPIIADPNREIAVKLGMLDAVSKDAAGLPLTARAVFIFGPDKTLKLSILYPATTGRNFNEIIRVLDSLQLTSQRRLATPADWDHGQDCVVASSVTTEDARKLFPKGVRIVDLPSKKPYLRFTPDPSGDEAPTLPPLAAVTPSAPKQSGLNLGDVLPNFEADTTQGKIKFHDFLGSSWGVLFSHPADFTPVCTTELSSVAKLDQEFRSRDVKVACISCDPVDSHRAWSDDIVAYCGTDIKELPFPIIADEKREIATQLGMLDAVSKDAAGLPNTCRAVFIIGPDKKLKLSLLYPATTGRNFREVLRAIDSLQLTATRRLATPGNWILGQDCVVASSVSTEEAIKLFPKGVRIVDLPSKKPYLRFTPFPDDGQQKPAPAEQKPSVSAEDWSKSDAQLLADNAFKELYARFSKPCSDESLHNAVKSLEGQKYTVKVCETKEDALVFLTSLLKEKISVSNGTSTTLEQIGWIDYLKANDERIVNYKSRAVKAMAAGDNAEYANLMQQGATADLFVSSVGAVAETGEIIGGDLTGTRMSGWLAAKHVVLVAGTNKVVRDLVEAKQRLHEYQLKLESARVRVAYKVPASAVNNEIILNGANPMQPHTTVVLIKESLGF